MPKQAEAKRDGLINPQNNNFKKRKILMLLKHYESTEVDRRTWLHVLSGTLWSGSLIFIVAFVLENAIIVNYKIKFLNIITFES